MSKKRIFQLCCVPERVGNVNRKLKMNRNDDRLGFINNTCFKGLLMVNQRLNLDAIMTLISRWDIESQSFVFNDGTKWKITEAGVSNVYGLPCGLGKLPIDPDASNIDTAFSCAFAAEYNFEFAKGRSVKGEKLAKLLIGTNEALNQSPVDFWRVYVLNALYSLLIPTSARSISIKILEFLRDPEDASRYNWAMLVKDRILRGLNDVKKKIDKGDVRSARPSGDLHCVWHMLCERMNNTISEDRTFTCGIKKNVQEDVTSFLGMVNEDEPNRANSSPMNNVLMIDWRQQESSDNDDMRNEEDECLAEIAVCERGIEELTLRKLAAEKRLKELQQKKAERGADQKDDLMADSEDKQEQDSPEYAQPVSVCVSEGTVIIAKASSLQSL